MKTLAMALTLTLIVTGASRAETIVDGVVYPEITELSADRGTVRSASYRSTTIPADAAPSLLPVAASTPTVQHSVAVPYAYGHGYTSVGAPQKVVQVIQPIGYTNSLPPPQVTYIQPVSYAQPITTSVQPLTNVQTPFNPYAQTKSVPWRPIVPIRNMPDSYVVGQGVIGQPKVYVPSQPVRNFIRYITP